MSIAREDILSALKTQIEKIATPTYYTDLRGNIYIWRKTPIEQKEQWCVIIQDETDDVLLQDASTPSDSWKHQLGVRIFIIAKPNTDQSLIRKAIIDIQRALGSNQTLDDSVHYIEYQGDIMNYEHQGQIVADALISLTIYYRTKQWSES